MKDELRQDIESLVLDGNVAKLPTSQLNNYPALKKAMFNAGGRYKRNTFIFTSDAKDVINEMLGSGEDNLKKKYQFFATPDDLADHMMKDVIFDKNKMKVLEPSAGHGALIKSLLKIKPCDIELWVDAIELNQANYNILSEYLSNEDKCRSLSLCADFLECNLEHKYDLIIANPPFAKNQDIDHIKKMYGLLAPGGRIITISSQSWYNGSQKKQVAFKEWLYEIGAKYGELSAGHFKESGTNVSSMLIVIDK